MALSSLCKKSCSAASCPCVAVEIGSLSRYPAHSLHVSRSTCGPTGAFPSSLGGRLARLVGQAWRTRSNPDRPILLTDAGGSLLLIPSACNYSLSFGRPSPPGLSLGGRSSRSIDYAYCSFLKGSRHFGQSAHHLSVEAGDWSQAEILFWRCGG